MTKVDLSCADISGMTNMNRLFLGFKNVEHFDLSSFDTSGVTIMNDMFYGCRSLTVLDLSGFDFSNVKEMKRMFGLCESLKEVVVSDSILCAGRVPHKTGRYVLEEENTWSGAHTPSQADFAGTLQMVNVPEVIEIPFGKATESERHAYLGLDEHVKITIVPHRQR